MSIRSFVALSSLLLMAWLGWAYVHTPVVRSGADPVTAEGDELLLAEEEAEKLAASVSP